MLNRQTPDACIAIRIETGEIAGWVSEGYASDMVKEHRATVIARRNGSPRAICLIANESEPLSGANRTKAIAGYIGAVKYTYQEELNNGKLVMLKRALPNGQFVPWPRSA